MKNHHIRDDFSLRVFYKGDTIYARMATSISSEKLFQPDPNNSEKEAEQDPYATHLVFNKSDGVQNNEEPSRRGALYRHSANKNSGVSNIDPEALTTAQELFVRNVQKKVGKGQGEVIPSVFSIGAIPVYLTGLILRAKNKNQGDKVKKLEAFSRQIRMTASKKDAIEHITKAQEQDTLSQFDAGNLLKEIEKKNPTQPLFDTWMNEAESPDFKPSVKSEIQEDPSFVPEIVFDSMGAEENPEEAAPAPDTIEVDAILKKYDEEKAARVETKFENDGTNIFDESEEIKASKEYLQGIIDSYGKGPISDGLTGLAEYISLYVHDSVKVQESIEEAFATGYLNGEQRKKLFDLLGINYAHKDLLDTFVSGKSAHDEAISTPTSFERGQEDTTAEMESEVNVDEMFIIPQEEKVKITDEEIDAYLESEPFNLSPDIRDELMDYILQENGPRDLVWLPGALTSVGTFKEAIDLVNNFHSQKVLQELDRRAIVNLLYKGLKEIIRGKNTDSNGIEHKETESVVQSRAEEPLEIHERTSVPQAEVDPEIWNLLRVADTDPTSTIEDIVTKIEVIRGARIPFSIRERILHAQSFQEIADIIESHLNDFTVIGEQNKKTISSSLPDEVFRQLTSQPSQEVLDQRTPSPSNFDTWMEEGKDQNQTSQPSEEERLMQEMDERETNPLEADTTQERKFPPPLPPEALPQNPTSETFKDWMTDTPEQLEKRLEDARSAYASEVVKWKNENRKKKNWFMKTMADLGVYDKKAPEEEKKPEYLEAERVYLLAKSQLREYSLTQSSRQIKDYVHERGSGKFEIKNIDALLAKDVEEEHEKLQKSIEGGFSPLEKGIMRKAMEKVSYYNSRLTPGQRLVLTSSAAAAVGLTVGGMTLGGAAVYGGYRAARAGAGVIASRYVGNKMESEHVEVSKSKKEKILKEYLDGLTIENYTEKEKKLIQGLEQIQGDEKVHRLTKGIAMAAMGGLATLGMGSLQNLAMTDHLPIGVPKGPGLPDDLKRPSLRVTPELKQTSVEVDVDSRGMISTFGKLKKVLIDKYGSERNFPPKIQEMMGKSPEELAVKGGFWKPGEGQSAQVMKGDTIEIEDDGDFVLKHAGGKVEKIFDAEKHKFSKFHGKMVSDHPVRQLKVTSMDQPSSVPESIAEDAESINSSETFTAQDTPVYDEPGNSAEPKIEVAGGYDDANAPLETPTNSLPHETVLTADNSFVESPEMGVNIPESGVKMTNVTEFPGRSVDIVEVPGGHALSVEGVEVAHEISLPQGKFLVLDEKFRSLSPKNTIIQNTFTKVFQERYFGENGPFVQIAHPSFEGRPVIVAALRNEVTGEADPNNAYVFFDGRPIAKGSLSKGLEFDTKFKSGPLSSKNINELAFERVKPALIQVSNLYKGVNNSGANLKAA